MNLALSADIVHASERAVFSEAFLSSRQVARFTHCPYPNEGEAKTAYVNKAFREKEATAG